MYVKLGSRNLNWRANMVVVLEAAEGSMRVCSQELAVLEMVVGTRLVCSVVEEVDCCMVQVEGCIVGD